MDAFDREWLSDMLEFARTTVRLLGTRDEAALASDDRTLLAVSHALQIVGEAANHVSPEAKAALVEIPWVDVVGMRHHLVHGYRTRSIQLIAHTIQEDLPCSS